MSEFKVNEDMFGKYCRIPTGYSKEMHIYKMVGAFVSNSYCDVPIVANSTEILHKDCVPVANVIHCGIDETKVIRVALHDCKICEVKSNER